MIDTVEPLILDLLESLASGPRPYPEVLDAWRTSCPRLPVWEEANSRGLLDITHVPGTVAQVGLSGKGRATLRAAGRQVAAARVVAS